MNKEIPILFSTPMVQAILDNRKTMTRRIVKLPKCDYPQSWQTSGEVDAGVCVFENDTWGKEIDIKCPYGKPGDLLWVRETYTIFEPEHCEGMSDRFCYKASFHESNEDWRQECIEKGYFYNWKPSIFMKKLHARIWLEVTGVRVERLHDISRGDAMEEGCPYPNIANEASPCMWFKDLWLTINGYESWDVNPWVWVVSFRVLSTKGKT